MLKSETTIEQGSRRKEGIREAVSATWQVEWAEFAMAPALRCVFGMAVVLLLGLKYHNVVAGVMAASGALTVGFGSFYRFRWSRTAPMLLATLGITLSAFISAITGHTVLGLTVIVCIWAYGCGLLQTLGGGLWWVSLQCVIFALIASSFPVGLGDTATRTLMVLGGGLFQMLCILVFWRLEGAKPVSTPDTMVEVPFSLSVVRESARSFWTHLRQNISPTTPVGRSALQLAVVVALAAVLSRLLPLRNSYWMPLTALLVMNTNWRQTFTMSLARFAGTLLGGGLATLLAVTLHPGPMELVGLVVVFAFLSFLFLRVNYAVYAIFITAFVVFQLACLGMPTAALVPARIIDTALGGALALCLQALWPAPRTESAIPAQKEVGSA